MLESKRRATIFLLIAFLLAAVAGYLVLEKVKSLNAELGGMTTIYIAQDDIASRTPIASNQLTTMQIPNRFVTSSYIRNEKDVKSMVSVVPLNKGDVITKNMLKPVSNLRNENHRLVAIYRSDKIIFDQVIEALDRVDIIVSNEAKGEKETKVFMKDVPVAYAQGSNKKFAGIAVEVSAEDAPKLIHIENYGEHIRILKANVGRDDQPPEQTEPVSDESKSSTDKSTAPQQQDKPTSTKPSAAPTKQKTTSEKPATKTPAPAPTTTKSNN